MTNPRLAGQPTPAAGEIHHVQILWDPGPQEAASLPRSYFEAVEVHGASSAARRITDVTLTGERELTVWIEGLFEYLWYLGGEFSFSLAFPDRRGYLDCRHPGMNDRYLLDVTLVLGPRGDTVSAVFEQRVLLGAI